MQALLTPYVINKNLTLKNKIVMAPMTRNMADDHLCPTAAMAEYYAKRADVGLIVTEGTIIRPDARGYTNVPGIYTPAQIEAWKRVTDKVHQKDGKIFLQIWHVGRVSHPHFLNGELPIAPSETMMSGKVKRADKLIFGKSRAVSVSEIKGLIDSYAQAAKNAMQAEFDGVEIHGANGYLIDQFLHYHTNLRTDNYGETAENMSRFALDVVKACGDTIGFPRVGLRLSPGAYLNEIVGDARDAGVFQHLLTKLNDIPVAYIHTGSFDDKISYPELGSKTMSSFMRNHYQGNLIACGSYNFTEAGEGIQQNKFDLIAIGRPLIANPDLIQRLKNQTDLKSYDASMLTVLN